MSLDPQVASIVELIAKAGFPPIWQASPEEARKGWDGFVRAFQYNAEPIGRTDDGVLPGPAGNLAFRLYTPAGRTDDRLPGILYFHGGGFVFGSIDSHDGLCRILCNASACRVVSVSYRLAPEHKFPAAFEDAFAAATWVMSRAGELGCDPGRMAIAGDSAGATLSAAVCRAARRAGDAWPALQALFCPATDCQRSSVSRQAMADDPFLDRRVLQWFLDQLVEPGQDLSDPRLSPLLAPDLAGLPPAHIHTAECDPLRDEGRAYADLLERAGVPVRYICHAGMPHPFFSMTYAVPSARAALEQAGAAIRRALAELG